MANTEIILFWIAFTCLGVSILLSIWRFVAVRSAVAANNGEQKITVNASVQVPTYLTLGATILSLILVTASLAVRAILTGHGPFSNMYEFAVAFAWGIIAVSLFFWFRYRIPILHTLSIVIALGLMIFAAQQPSRAVPLMPALQQSLLLTTHVASAVFSYGAFTVGFCAAILYLIRYRTGDSEVLDQISYHAVMIGFPFMTLVIVLGALWADVAWGSYWSWDPKETASLVTWLLYAAYLHARVMRGWRGRRAAALLIIGFAAVIFTFFGNYFFTGMHSYG